MRTLSTRALAALAYERGEELDPAALPSSALLADLCLAGEARAIVPEPSAYARARARRRARAACPRRRLDERDEFGPIAATPGLLTAPTHPWALDERDGTGRPLSAWVPDGALL